MPVRLHDTHYKQDLIERFGLSEQIPTSILNALTLVSFSRGGYLCRAGEKIDSLYLLVEGKVQISFVHSTGQWTVFAFETPLSIVGELELIMDSVEMTNVSLQAVADSLLLVAPLSIVHQYGYDDARFLRFLLRNIVQKLYFSSTLLSQAPLSVEARLAYYLLDTYQQEGTPFQLEKREAVAALLGTSTRHLNRTLKRLAPAVAVRNKTVYVHDPAILRTIIEKRT